MNSPSNTYDVGYAKPPVSTQFKKGQSGNPAGRARGKANLATVLERAISAGVVVNEGGRRTTKSKLEVAVTQAVNKAANGDLKALNIVIKLLPILDPTVAQEIVSPDLVADRELAMKLAQRIAARALLAKAEESSHGPE
jgi:hypothetical protein